MFKTKKTTKQPYILGLFLYLLKMKLTKKENQIVIRCLSDIQFLNKTNKNPFISSIDLKDLPLIIQKFKNYQKVL